MQWWTREKRWLDIQLVSFEQGGHNPHRVRSKHLVFQRLTSSTRGHGVDGVLDERQAVHGVDHPLLSLSIEQAAVV